MISNMLSTVRKSLVALVLASLALSGASKKLIHPKEFPKGRPFSPGIQVGNTLWVAGQIGQDLATGKIPEKFEDEVARTLDNIGLVLKEAGYTFDDVVSVNVYLTDMDLFQRMNAVYITYFKEPRPVRTTVGTPRLAGPAKVEITVTASK
jgi:2-iminobutanoate/2-iminopropanoate deaminase